MLVSTNSLDNNIIAQIEQLTAQQTQLQTEVSTGLRISAPSDDPTAFGRVMVDNTESRANAQYSANATAALATSQATYSALQQIKSISDRATQIGTLATGTLGSAGMSAYGAEVDQLIQQTVQLGNSQLNNTYLFSGTAVTTTPFTTTTNAQGEITAVAYAGNGSQASIPISSSANLAPGADPATNQGITSFLNNLISLRDALNANDPAATATAQSGLLSTENTIVNSISEQGAVQTRIQVSQDQQTSLAQTLGQLVSNETSTDLPTTVAKLTQAQNAYQAAVQSAAALMQKNILTYLPIQ